MARSRQRGVTRAAWTLAGHQATTTAAAVDASAVTV
jgi:hypothetical protein